MEAERIKEETEAKRNAEEEKKLKEEAEIRRRAEEERRMKEEAEAKRKAGEEKRLAEEAEAKRKIEEEKRRKEEAEAKRRAEEERRRKEETEAKIKAEEDQRLFEAANAERSIKKRKSRKLMVIGAGVIVIAFGGWGIIKMMAGSTNPGPQPNPVDPDIDIVNQDSINRVLREQDSIAWNDAFAKNEKATYQSYLDGFGTGRYRTMAREKIDSIEKAEIFSRLKPGDVYLDGIVLAINPETKACALAYKTDLGKMSYPKAVDACKSISSAGIDWILPALDDLKLMHLLGEELANNPFNFKNDYYWSSTDYSSNEKKVKNMVSGYEAHYSNSFENRQYYVRPVRTVFKN